MRHFNVGNYALFFAGCYLGAGFVSGNELTQFFGNFGLSGFWGLIIIFLGFTAIGTIATRLSQVSGITEVDRLAFGDGMRPLRAAMAAMQIALMFAILVIVTAGVGALTASLLSLPAWLGSLLFAVILGALSLLGAAGIARLLSISVPMLILTVAVTSICLFGKWITTGCPMPAGEADNPLLPNFWIAALTYISFNMGGNITVVVATSGQIKPRRVLAGTMLGAFFLAFVASAILITLSLFPEAMREEMPMLAAMQALSPLLGALYGLLLFLAMTGSGLSKCFGLSHYFKTKLPTVARHPRAFSILLVAVACLCSLVGFGELVGTVYPVFGYLSLLILGGLAVRAVRILRHKKNEP